MADKNTIARPYARALFAVAREAGAIEEVSASLGVSRELLRDGRVEEFLADPVQSDGTRLDFLAGLFAALAGAGSVFAGESEHGRNFLRLLLAYGRVGVLPEIADHFDALKKALQNSVDVTVTSASPINAAQQAEITAALRARLGREINLATELDENLIGGAVIRAGDVVIDGSVRTRLDGLARALVS